MNLTEYEIKRLLSQ